MMLGVGHARAVDPFEELRRRVPVLSGVEPTGPALMEDLDAAGGVPTVLGQLGDLIEGSVRLADGSSTRELQQRARAANGPVHSLDDPVDAAGAFRVVRGNLAPDGCVVKLAGTERLQQTGPARVFESEEEAFDAVAQQTLKPGDIIVIRNEGPVGGPGMQGMLSVTAALVGCDEAKTLVVAEPLDRPGTHR